MIWFDVIGVVILAAFIFCGYLIVALVLGCLSYLAIWGMGDQIVISLEVAHY